MQPAAVFYQTSHITVDGQTLDYCTAFKSCKECLLEKAANKVLSAEVTEVCELCGSPDNLEACDICGQDACPSCRVEKVCNDCANRSEFYCA